MQRLPALLRMMRRRSREGPPARYDVTWEPAIPVPAADGSPLLTDHYAPVTDEPCDTVLVRSPYGRGFPWNYLFGALFAEQGFHVVVQSTRGTGGSGGEFHTWRHEPADGQAAVAWLRGQEWFNGSFHTVGGSYLGYVQWALALDPPPEWRSASIQICVHDFRDFWRTGAFALEMGLVGGLALYTQAQGPLGYAWGILRFARRHRYVERAVPLLDVYSRAVGGRRPEFEGWLTHPDRDDPFWTGADTGPGADLLTVPTSLSTGWFDLALDQTLEQYSRMRRAGHDPALLIGRWTHTSAYDRGWSELFGQAMGRMRGAEPAARVRVHVGGADEWRELPEWPPAAATPRTFHLGPGTLGAEPGTGATTFHYDPADPTPSIGGPLQSNTKGPRDNATLEKRADVRTFTTEPLTAPIEVLGPVRAEFAASSTAASADLFARLCDVDPGGRSVNVCDGLARIRDGRTIVAMSSTAHRFRAGHRIRLQVSGGAHPRFARNYGTGEPLATATRMVATDTTVRHTSALILPVV
jgi:putative CocE/NonD family hydrolase